MEKRNSGELVRTKKAYTPPKLETYGNLRTVTEANTPSYTRRDTPPAQPYNHS